MRWHQHPEQILLLCSSCRFDSSSFFSLFFLLQSLEQSLFANTLWNDLMEGLELQPERSSFQLPSQFLSQPSDTALDPKLGVDFHIKHIYLNAGNFLKLQDNSSLDPNYFNLSWVKCTPGMAAAEATWGCLQLSPLPSQSVQTGVKFSVLESSCTPLLFRFEFSVDFIAFAHSIFSVQAAYLAFRVASTSLLAFLRNWFTLVAPKWSH